jgi:IclR family acetate operon transcriptional repressor
MPLDADQNAADPALRRTSPPVGSRTVEQTVAVLQKLAGDGPGGVRELARDLDISKTSVHRILASLELSEMVVFQPETQLYALGPGFLTLLAGFNQRNQLIHAARTPVRRLHDETGETVEISVIVSHSRMILYSEESRFQLRYASMVGALYPIYSGSTGRTLLSTCTDEELDDHIANISFAPLSERTITDPAEFRRKVLETRERGYEVSWQESYEGVAGCSMPVRCRSPRHVALGIYGPSSRFTQERIDDYLNLLRSAVAEIEHELGTSAPAPMS